jgi:hypothetical protein
LVTMWRRCLQQPFQLMASPDFYFGKPRPAACLAAWATRRRGLDPASAFGDERRSVCHRLRRGGAAVLADGRLVFRGAPLLVVAALVVPHSNAATT